MKYSQRPKYERRNETIAVLVMILLCIPVLFIYFSFFANAFILDSTGELTLQNFQFLYQPIQLSQYTVEPIGKAFRNTVIFTAIATTLEVTISCMAGYALARMEFTGKRVISFSLLTLRLFPGVLLLIGVASMIIANTIKITVFNRRKEISIMKYVGATNWFIRGPFLAEGIIIGMIAAAISSGLISLLYYYLSNALSLQFLVLFSTGLVPIGFMSANLIIIFTSLGISIGAGGSIISMRKFLDA